ncbi:unnamed protein product [Heligmosomoides polygyrus]|uniref:Frizzled-4 n=1 Tax=Heligmosomoides polygyrus TaxID=6339 RepID=A0A3P7U7R3_HELPZ|nr:unnamed protein product [Heligmosomoides polygyrus]
MLPSSRKCVPLKIPMCIDLPYNSTVYPNLLNHQTQEDAEIAINQFSPLVKVRCSEDIKLFLCTVYAPVCTQLERPIQPCRDLCISARNGCESLMIKFGFRWPEQLDCKHFPTEGICVGENKTSTPPPNSHFRSHNSQSSLECPLTMSASMRSHFSLPLSSGTLEDCSLPCAADNQVPVFFDKRHRRYLRFWTGGWAVACCVCALFTITTFLIDLARFAYPVRPILYMAMCYLMISIVYMIGVVGEDSFACGPYGGTPQLLVAQGGEGTACSALAVAHYYFTIASSVWWLVLCLSWFLAANRKWGAESIAGLAPYLHAACWGIPALLSVVVLVTNSIDGDVFTGICSVGNLQPKALLYYLFLPLTGFLGLFLLACGICSMMRIRTYIKLQHADVDKNIRKLEKLMFRWGGGFAVMYVLPTAASAAVLCYQAIQMPSWIDTLYTLRCLHPDRDKFGFTMPRTSCSQRMDTISPGPELVLIFIKYLCQLIVGITCAVWICSAKTVASYQKAYARIVLRRAAVATDEH